MPGLYRSALSLFMQRDGEEIPGVISSIPVSYSIYAEKRTAVIYAPVH